MAELSALNSGLQGIQRGLQRAQRSAAEIASANKGESTAADLTRPMVDLLAQRTQVQASAKVVETAADLIGTLFDDRA